MQHQWFPRQRAIVASLITLALVWSLLPISPFDVVVRVKAASTFIVNSTADTGDATPDGVCNDGLGNCTLREAIQEANANSDLTEIDFAITGGGPHTISPASALPATIFPVDIDGTTQTGFVVGTATTAVVPSIILSGTLAGLPVDGLHIQGGDSTVRGLSIRNFTLRGIFVSNPVVNSTDNNNTIADCEISANNTGITISADPNFGAASNNVVTGSYIHNNTAGGVAISQASGNQIGGTAAGAGNIISGNGGFDGTGIAVTGVKSFNNVIAGNKIGTNPAGTAAAANGIGVLIQAPDNTVGGNSVAARNVISGNIRDGVLLGDNSGGLLVPASPTGSTVKGNYIGVTADGSTALGNGRAGVYFSLILPTVTGEVSGNVISGNGSSALNFIREGIRIEGDRSSVDETLRAASNKQITPNVVSSSGITIRGNLIGTAANGTSNIGNGGDGIVIVDFANCVIGGTVSGEGNTIAFNGGNGVVVNDNTIPDFETAIAVGNAIRGNSIHTNTGLGIDLVSLDPDTFELTIGPNPNDEDDPDTGANHLQNFPVLTNPAMIENDGDIIISGTLNSTPSTQFAIDFFANTAADGAVDSEGRTYIGSLSITTDANGDQTFNTTLTPPQVVPIGSYITATATRSSATGPTGTQGDTSEFSAAVPTVSADIVPATVTSIDDGDADDLVPANQLMTYTVTFNEDIDASTVTAADFDNAGTAPITIGTISETTATSGVFLVQVTPTNTGTLILRIPSGAVINDVAGNALVTPVQDDTTVTVLPSADLSITKTDGQTSEVPGTAVSYTIVVTNNGPSDVMAATVADTFPSDITGVTYTSVAAGGATGNTAAGPGNINDTVDMPSGSSITYTVSGTINPSATSSLSNTATVTAPAGTVDPDTANNSATDTDTLTVTADLSITKTDGQTSEVPGTAVSYTIVVTNNGPSDVMAATVADTFPSDIIGVTYTSIAAGGATGNTAAGPGNINDTVDMPSGSSITYTVSGTINPSATSNLSNTATVTAPAGTVDPDTANNSATDTDTLTVTADLSITKTDGQTSEVPGTAVSYTIVVTNNGPSDVMAATVADTFPSDIIGVTYTSVAAGGATGNTAAGPGNINDTVDMPSGSSITYTVSGTINPSATSNLSNTATVTAPAGTVDPDTANNSATDTDTLTVTADLSITKTDGQTSEVPGTAVSYTIVVTNNGPSDVMAATVADTFPSDIIGVTYTSIAAGGATGNTAAGPGNINDTVDMPSGSSITYTVSGTINPSATSSLSNTATVTAPAGTTDPDTANNTATDTDTLTGSADLEIISKADTPDPVIAGNNITYTISFRNNGPSDAQTVTVTDGVPANTTFVSAAVTSGTGWTIPSPPAVGGTGNVVFSKATVDAGETATFQLVVKVNSNTPAATLISNDALAASATIDPAPGNNTGNATTTVGTSADLLVVKIDTPDPVGVGQNLTYTITVSNGGASDAQNVSLSDTLPSSTTLVSFTVPAGWTRTDAVAAGGTGTVTATAPALVAGTDAVFTLVVNVNAATPHNTVLTNSATATTTTTDPNPINNTGTATTTVVSQPDLTITKTHAGNFSQGQMGATYTITVSNSAGGPTDGSAVTVTDNVPVGLTPTGPAGAHNGWTCAINGQTLTCSRSDVLGGNSSYPSITLTVNVANPAPLSVTNTATVSGGGETNTGNNSASDPTTINCTQDFSLNNTSPLMISRFRMNGPAGPLDEFVEIFNPSTTAHTVASGNCAGGGYGVYASAGNGTNSNSVSLVCQIPNGTVIPAGGYYLCTGATYSLSNLGRNGGAEGATSVADAPIGCGGSCVADIRDDAGLALLNVAQGVTLTVGGGFLGGVPDAGLNIYDKVGFGPYGGGAPAPGYPSLAGNFCEGAACLKPVGDVSTGGACINSSGLFPVVSVPPPCYGQAGQYELLRRQTAFDPNLGTVHLDTNNSANDWMLVAPNSAINMGLGVTGVLGVTAIHGAAGPQGSTAPADTPSVSLKQATFDAGATQLGAPNAERNYGQDPDDPRSGQQSRWHLCTAAAVHQQLGQQHLGTAVQSRSNIDPLWRTGWNSDGRQRQCQKPGGVA